MLIIHILFCKAAISIDFGHEKFQCFLPRQLCRSACKILRDQAWLAVVRGVFDFVVPLVVYILMTRHESLEIVYAHIIVSLSVVTLSAVILLISPSQYIKFILHC